MEPFKPHSLYPDYDQPFLTHFDGMFETVFIGFFPFFRMPNTATIESAFSKSVETTIEELRKQDEIYQKMEATGATIYAANADYPKQDEILEHGIIVPWDDVRDRVGFANNSDLYKALKTSIGAYSKEFRRPELNEKLQNFVQSDQIWAPGEGEYAVLTLKKIYNSFILLDKKRIVVEDEFHEEKKEYDLGLLTVEEFVEAIGGRDYYIYAQDQSILFSVDWDSFFFIIGASLASITKIVDAQYFEGFIADPCTTHNWEHGQ